VRSISVASRLAAAVVAVSVISLVIATLVGVGAGRDLADDLTDDRLSSLRTTAAADIASEMRSIARTADALAASPGAAEAVESFARALDELEVADPDEVAADADLLIEQYETQFLELFEAVGVDVTASDLIDEADVASLRLQTAYSLLGESEAEAADVEDSGDGSEWSEIHQEVHPTLRDIVVRQGLQDLLLVEPDNGTVVYSVAKRPDLGTSFNAGPFSGSVIATSVDDVRADPAAGTIVTDVAMYLPAGVQPVGAVTSPVLDGDDLIGIVVLVYDTAEFTDLLTAGGEWDEAGYPETGETFMVAGDGTMRSEPRSFLENPTQHLDAAEAAEAIDEEGRRRIVLADSTVLVERADDETVNAGRDGDPSVRSAVNVTGTDVFSTVTSVPIEGVEWYIVSEVERVVAEGDLEDFSNVLIVGAAIFVVLIAFAAVAWSSSIVSTIREMSERLRTWRSSSGPLAVGDRSPVEIESLAHSFTEMMTSLDRQREELADARAKKMELLRSMLPDQVAERVASGELESIEEVPKVSVAVIVVDGLGDLVRIGEGETNRVVLDRLMEELDELAERHGLERIKIVGDAYFAVCGHHRPYIDHAPRALSFAGDAQDAVRETAIGRGVSLDVTAGIDTGPVNVGMTRASGLVYDVWGPTVSIAHELARIGRRGQVLVSPTTLALLPESIEAQQLPGEREASVVTVSSVGGAV
jgi:class 3 adenylate cyclase